MGYSQSKESNYGVYIENDKEGETKIIRHPAIGNKELPKEPFKGVNTMWKALEFSVNNLPNNRFLGTRLRNSNGELADYSWKTYSEAFEIIKYFACGLEKLNLCEEKDFTKEGSSKFKFFGICSRNREEWVIADYACHALGVTVITFYDTLGDDTIEYICNQTKLNTIIVESEKLKMLVKISKCKLLGEVKSIIVMENIDSLSKEASENIEFLKRMKIEVLFFDEIISTGKKYYNVFSINKLSNYDPKNIATFCYTSGTTGVPKGAMLSHEAIIADTAAMQFSDAQIESTDIYISYLPLAHVMERVAVTACVIKSAAIGFYQGNPLKIIEDAQLLKPTLFLGVPRVYQRVVEKIKERIKNSNFVNRNLAYKAISDKLYNYENYGKLNHFIWDKLVFKKMKMALGGNIRFLMSGSAPLSKEIKSFMMICFSCPLIEGYGTTENCGAASFTSIEDYAGNSVGGIICSLEMKLIDVKEMNYLTNPINIKDDDLYKTSLNENYSRNNSKVTTNESNIITESTNYKSKIQVVTEPFLPSGEILLRGPTIFSGYFLDAENTASAIDKEGWLHTGDIGVILPNMTLRIVDRRKNIFKLSIGEYVAPEKIENILINNDYISQIFVYGEPIESVIVAIIVPNIRMCFEYLNSQGIKTDLSIVTDDTEKLLKEKKNIDKVLNNKILIDYLIDIIDKYSRSKGLKGFEVVKSVRLKSTPFSVENNLLTPSLKLKRHEAKIIFKKEIKEMYEEIHLK
jgi:long-chain acyl-CoA synthetase